MDDAADVRIGSKVRALRESAAMSVRDLGAKLEIDAEALLSIEGGMARAGVPMLGRLGEIFSVPVWSFFETSAEASGNLRGICEVTIIN
jgi:transcriptional regulator with XRE-family HTH domain